MFCKVIQFHNVLVNCGLVGAKTGVGRKKTTLESTGETDKNSNLPPGASSHFREIENYQTSAHISKLALGRLWRAEWVTRGANRASQLARLSVDKPRLRQQYQGFQPRAL